MQRQGLHGDLFNIEPTYNIVMTMTLSIKNYCLFLLLLSLSCGSLAAENTDKQNTEHANILIYGDSLSAGYGLQAKEDWPFLLQQTLNSNGYTRYRIINESISGETTSGGLARLSKLLTKHQPRIMILELGANDGLRGQSIKAMKQRLASMITQAKVQNITVLLAAMQIPPNYGKRYTTSFTNAFTTVAKQHDIKLIPFILLDIANQPELMQDDDLHPTAKAQPLISKIVYKSLDGILQRQP